MILSLPDQSNSCTEFIERYTDFPNKKILALYGGHFIVQIKIKTVRKLLTELDWKLFQF